MGHLLAGPLPKTSVSRAITPIGWQSAHLHATRRARSASHEPRRRDRGWSSRRSGRWPAASKGERGPFGRATTNLYATVCTSGQRAGAWRSAYRCIPMHRVHSIPRDHHHQGVRRASSAWPLGTLGAPPLRRAEGVKPSRRGPSLASRAFVHARPSAAPPRALSM